MHQCERYFKAHYTASLNEPLEAFLEAKTKRPPKGPYLISMIEVRVHILPLVRWAPTGRDVDAVNQFRRFLTYVFWYNQIYRGNMIDRKVELTVKSNWLLGVLTTKNNLFLITKHPQIPPL